MSNPYGDGPEARQALEDELAEVRREYNDYLDSIDSYDAWWDRQLDRADFARDQARDAEWDRAVKQADVFGQFLDKLMGGK